MKQSSKRPLFVLMAFVLLIGSGVTYMYIAADPPGYCRDQQRYISDEEFALASLALLTWEERQHKINWDANPKLYERDLKAHDRMEHNRSRPGFVSIYRGNTHTIFRWLLGYQQIRVTLNANSGDEFIRFYYDACGNFITSDLGGSYPGYKKLTTTNYLEILNKR